MGQACGRGARAPARHAMIPADLETGDIVLFNTKSSAGAITRCCTQGQWDHVAIVLRTEQGYRTVECTGQGIGCWVLQERLDDHIVKAAAVRRLKADLTNDMINTLNSFLQSVKDKPYRTQTCLWLRLLYCSDSKATFDEMEQRDDPTILSTRKNDHKSNKYAIDSYSASQPSPSKPAFQDPTQHQQLQDKKNFFCSSFVAACFMKMGLLPMSQCVDHYLPGHFASTHTLPWLNEAYLDDEIHIVKVPRDEWDKSRLTGNTAPTSTICQPNKHNTMNPPQHHRTSSSPIDPVKHAKYLNKTFSSQDQKSRPPPIQLIQSFSLHSIPATSSSPTHSYAVPSPTSPHSLTSWSKQQQQQQQPTLFVETIAEQLNIAMTFKQMGNDAYMKKDYRRALSSYTKILGYVCGLHPVHLVSRIHSFLPSCDHHSFYHSFFTLQSTSTESCTTQQLSQISLLMISVHLNMSACMMKLKNARGAWRHAHTVISLDPTVGKAWARRGDAYMMMGGDYACLAERDLSEAASLLPLDRAVAASLQQARTVLLARNPSLALERVLISTGSSSAASTFTPTSTSPDTTLPDAPLQLLSLSSLA